MLRALTHERLGDPEREVVTIEEAMLQCRADDDDDIRAAVQALICAARDHVEMLLDAPLVERLMRAGYDRQFCGYRELAIPCPPLRSVERVYFVGEGGVETEISPTHYTVSRSSRQPSILRFRCQKFAPCSASATPLYVDFTAGYSLPEDVPASLRQAVLLVVDDWFNNTALADTNSISEAVAKTVSRLISPFKHRNI